MQFLRTDADFSAKAEFKPVGKASRRIDIHGCRIDFLLKPAGVCIITGDNRFRMFGAEPVDMFQRFLQAADHFDRQNKIEIFRCPVLFSRRFHCGMIPRSFRTAADFDACLHKPLKQVRQQMVGDVSMNQQRFHRVADARA